MRVFALLLPFSLAFSDSGGNWKIECNKGIAMWCTCFIVNLKMRQWLKLYFSLFARQRNYTAHQHKNPMF